MLSTDATHLRFLPGALAREMVASGSAVVAHANGRVKAIMLIEVASTHATRLGPATAVGAVPATRFVVKERYSYTCSSVKHHGDDST